VLSEKIGDLANGMLLSEHLPNDLALCETELREATAGKRLRHMQAV
jgi:hypothetical protein